jgi:hypothetical protein
MNDSTEFSIITDLLEAEGRESRNPVGGQHLFEVLKRFVNISMKVNVCVVCFCDDKDLLSQWRGYSGSNGYGYSIGFNTTKLKEIALKADFTLHRCIYDQIEQKKIIKEILNDYEPRLTENIGDITPLMRQFSSEIIKHGAYFKHPSFRKENEWRLISKPLDVCDLRLRRGKSMMVPYCNKIQFHESPPPIDHVFIGPCPHMDLSAEAVRTLLQREKIGNLRLEPYRVEREVVPNVRRSKIPYRVW